jgi:acetylornithine deacetylase
MNNIELKILKQTDLNRDHIIQFLKKIVTIPSETGHENAIQQYIAGKLKEMGLELDMWDLDKEMLKKHPAYIDTDLSYENRPNLVAILKGTGGGRSLILNGHVDTIPLGPEAAWNHKPLSADIEQNKMYGRGTSDMKSGITAMTMAMEVIKKLGIELKGDVILQYVMDEEFTGNGTLACLLRGYIADAGICCETSSLHVQPGCIGRIWFKIKIKGKPAGIQKRYEGINAIDKGYYITQAVAELEAKRIKAASHHLYPDKLSSMPCMVGKIAAGDFPSAFPDQCLLEGSIATLPNEDNEIVKQQFITHIREASAADPWLKNHLPEVIFDGYCGDAAEIPVDHPVVTTLSDCFKTVAGKKPEISGRQGAADIRYLIKYGNIPTVIFGPGLTEQMHATNEYVNLDDLITATKCLAMTIVNWCGVQE